MILVIDDDPHIPVLIVELLTDDGYQVVTASHGAAGLELVKATPPALILLDMNMPVMNGWQFAKAYRQTPGPHAPIVVMTASMDVRKAAAMIAADDALAKPFDLSELLTVVERHVGLPVKVA